MLYQLLFSGSYHAGLTGVGKRLLLLLPSWLRNLSSLKMETEDNPCKSCGMSVFFGGVGTCEGMQTFFLHLQSTESEIVDLN